jgi:hypothetical protein
MFDWIKYGETTGSKICPERAVVMMKMKETREGEETYKHTAFMKANESNTPTFKYIEIFSEFQLKSYRSKTSEYFNGLVKGRDMVSTQEGRTR